MRWDCSLSLQIIDCDFVLWFGALSPNVPEGVMRTVEPFLHVNASSVWPMQAQMMRGMTKAVARRQPLDTHRRRTRMNCAQISSPLYTMAADLSCYHGESIQGFFESRPWNDSIQSVCSGSYTRERSPPWW